MSIPAQVAYGCHQRVLSTRELLMVPHLMNAPDRRLRTSQLPAGSCRFRERVAIVPGNRATLPGNGTPSNHFVAADVEMTIDHGAGIESNMPGTGAAGAAPGCETRYARQDSK